MYQKSDQRFHGVEALRLNTYFLESFPSKHLTSCRRRKSYFRSILAVLVFRSSVVLPQLVRYEMDFLLTDLIVLIVFFQVVLPSFARCTMQGGSSSAYSNHCLDCVILGGSSIVRPMRGGSSSMKPAGIPRGGATQVRRSVHHTSI